MYGILLHISLFVFGVIVLSRPGSLIHMVTRSHTTPLDEWSTRHTELYLTTHNTHNIQTSTLQHTALTTHRPLPYNTQHYQHTELYLTTHNTHNIQTSTLQHITLTTYRPLPYKMQQSQRTDNQAPAGIQNHNLIKRASADPRLRPHGLWYRNYYTFKHSIYIYIYNNFWRASWLTFWRRNYFFKFNTPCI